MLQSGPRIRLGPCLDETQCCPRKAEMFKDIRGFSSEVFPVPTIPRTRGDGPLAEVMDTIAKMAPPHTRRVGDDAGPADHGSPTHGGVEKAQRRAPQKGSTKSDNGRMAITKHQAKPKSADLRDSCQALHPQSPHCMRNTGICPAE